MLSGAPRPAPHQRPNTGLRFTRRSAERRASRLAPSGGSDGAIRTSHGRAASGPRRRTVQSHSRVLEHAVAPFAITYDMQLLLARPSDGWRSGTALSRPRDRMQRPPGQQSAPSSYTRESPRETLNDRLRPRVEPTRCDATERGTSYPERRCVHFAASTRAWRCGSTTTLSATRIVAHPEHRRPSHLVARRCDSLDVGQRSAASEAGPREDTALVFADECGSYCTPRPIQGFYIPRSTARRYEFSEPAGDLRGSGRLRR